MQPRQSPPRSSTVKRLVGIFVALAALYGLYVGVMAAVRAHTTGLIKDVVGRSLPDFSLISRSGARFSPASLRGKTVVLNFFRSACHGCMAEKEDIKRLARELDPDRVVLLGVMMDRVQGFTEDTTARTLAFFDYQHPVVMADEAFVEAFHGAGWAHITPVTYVADAEGALVAGFRYPYTLEELRRALP